MQVHARPYKLEEKPLKKSALACTGNQSSEANWGRAIHLLESVMKAKEKAVAEPDACYVRRRKHDEDVMILIADRRYISLWVNTTEGLISFVKQICQSRGIKCATSPGAS